MGSTACEGGILFVLSVHFLVGGQEGALIHYRTVSISFSNSRLDNTVKKVTGC